MKIDAMKEATNTNFIVYGLTIYGTRSRIDIYGSQSSVLCRCDTFIYP
jgi:hypothetical protein